MVEEKGKFVTVSIPVELAEKIKKKIEGTGFHSLSSYVTFVLREILINFEASKKETFNKKDEDKVKERLRSLGYM